MDELWHHTAMFKLHNPLVVIDLEATAGQDDRGRQTNNCIIDLGAVFLDEKLLVKGTFQALVKPTEAVTPFITKLTGITPAMVEDQPGFAEVGPAFARWVEGLAGNLKKVRLAAWGNYFDIPLLRRNFHDAGLDFPFPGTALDVKTLAFFWLSQSGRRTDKVSLEFFADHFGLKVGTWHRALADAEATAGTLAAIWRDLEGFFVPVKEGEPHRLVRWSTE
jgi:DNA polymerase III epsilon subunit-like protein